MTEKTGWPPCELMQDDCRPLSLWFASKVDARALAREAAISLSKPPDNELAQAEKPSDGNDLR